MPSKIKLVRRLAMTAVTVWKALPADKKKQALQLARKHGPTIAKNVAKARRGAKTK
jgi:hypothetical protein